MLCCVENHTSIAWCVASHRIHQHPNATITIMCNDLLETVCALGAGCVYCRMHHECAVIAINHIWIFLCNVRHVITSLILLLLLFMHSLWRSVPRTNIASALTIGLIIIIIIIMIIHLAQRRLKNHRNIE